MLSASLINYSLLFLVGVDGLLVFWVFVFPGHFHRTAFINPSEEHGYYFYRAGIVWAGFVLIQALAYVFWESHPIFLLIVAGVRFTELYADAFYLIAGPRMTGTGYLGFGFSPVFTTSFGLLFWYGYGLHGVI